MTYTQLQQLIKDNASPTLWLHDDGLGIWTLRCDLHVTIRQIRSDVGGDDFHEAWAKKVPDKTAKVVLFDLYFGASFVERHHMVAVDGHRAILPMPEIGNLSVPASKYHLARCIDFQNSLDDYMGRCGLSLES